MLKDYIDCKNDVTSKFLTDSPATATMSEETTSDSPIVEHVTTITMDDVYEIECSSVAEEIIVENVKCYDPSSSESEIVELLNNDGTEELQSPIASEVDQFINNKRINSNHVLGNNECDEFILANEESEPSNDLMEIDKSVFNKNLLTTTKNVEILPKQPVENVPQSKSMELPIQPSASETRPFTTEVTDKPYKCHICGKLFSRNSSLKCHIRLHVEGPDSLLRGSSQPLILKSHFEFNIKKEDTKKEEIIEPAVDTNTTDIVPYNEIVLNSSRESNELVDDDDKRDYKCIICEKTFSRKSSLTFHYKFHPKSPISKSQDGITVIIGETINDETEMDVDPEPSPDQYKCKKCNRLFTEKNMYLWHLKLHETNVHRKSSDCNSLSTNQTDSIKDLNDEITNDADVAIKHTNNSNDAEILYQCPHCPRSFPQLRGLKTHHRKKHVDDQSKVSETLSQIVYEEVSSRKYDCSKKLHNHNQVTKLYKCNVCCKCFCDIDNLKRHLTRDHKEEDTSEASDNDIVISRKKSISTMNDSKLSRKRVGESSQHQNTSVSLRGLYKCGLCNEAFDEIQSLSDHVTEHIKTHNDSMQSTTDESSAEELSCVVCEKTFRNQNSLSRHMNEHRRREEEILVRVTSSGRKIRERRPSEDMSTINPVKCIPCNRYFETIRAKRIHDSSKHPAGQPEPAELESSNGNDTADHNNKEYVCDCCNRPWANLRSLSIHKSWNRHKLLVASTNQTNANPLSIDDEDENEEIDSFESDDYTAAEENKTENDVTSSVKCGCCNELFPNIPALNAHLSGQTTGLVADASTLQVCEKKNLTSCDSLRDLVKCDRCDKFCSSIPALKLHIMSDHTKKTILQSSADNSSATISKPAAISDQLKKNITQNLSEASKLNIVDRTKKYVSQGSMELSPAPKSEVISERKRSVSKSSVEIYSTPAPKYQIISSSSRSTDPKSNCIPDQMKKLPFQSSIENSNTVLKLNISDLRRKSVSQSSTKNLSTSTSKSKIFDHTKKCISQSSTEDSQVLAVKSKSFSSSTKTSNITTKSSNISDQTEKSVQVLTENSSIPSAKLHVKISSINENSISQDPTNRLNIATEKSVSRDSIENLSIPTSEFRNVSNDVEKLVFQNSIETSNVSASDSDVIFDRTKKSTENLSIPALQPEIISDHTKQLESTNSIKEQIIISVHTADDITPIVSQSESQLENEKLTKAVVNAPGVCLNQTNDKSVVTLAQSVRRRKSAVEKILEQNDSLLQCDFCDETFTSNRALHSHKLTHVIERPSNTVVDSNSFEETPTFACCNRIFTSSRALKIHQNRHVPISKQAPNPTPTHDAAANISSASISTVTDSDEDVFREYLCTVCGNQLGSRKTLKMHRAKHFKGGEIDPEENKGTFQCPKCNRKFEKESSLRVHKAYHTMMENKTPIDHGTHTDMRNGIWKCNNCEREFVNVRGVIIHYAYAHKEKDPSQTFPCSKCDRSFNCSQGLAGHTWSAHLKHDHASNSGPYKESKNGIFKCNICDREFDNAKTVIRHHNRIHKEMNPEASDEEYSCSKCDRTFSCSQGLAGHMWAHKRGCALENPTTDDENEEEENPEDFSCSRCDKSFSISSSLKKHISKAHGKEPEPEPDYFCSTCEKSYASKTNLKRHLRTVHDINSTKDETETEQQSDDEKYPCSECDRVFESYHGLNGHMQVHQQYGCEDCNQTYSNIRIYNAHKEICTGKTVESENDFDSKPHSQNEFKCDQCDRSFPSARSLGGHKPVHYPNESDQDKDEQESDDDADNEADDQPSEFPCSRCDRSFENSRSLGVHMNFHTTADNPQELPCPKCERVFISFRALSTHFTNHRNEEGRHEFPCPKCKKSFNNVRSLYEHFGDVHKKVARRSSRLDSKSTPAKESEKSDSKSITAKEPEKRSQQSQPLILSEPLVNQENYSCTKCGEIFITDRSLSNHRRKCTSRSKSVEDPSSTRNVKTRSKSVGDRTNIRETPAENKVVESTPDSSVRKSRRLQSFSETMTEQQRKQQQHLDEQMDANVHSVAKENLQLLCVSKDQTDELNDITPKPNCDICTLTFDDFKSLAKHIANSHESISGASIDKRYEFSDFPVRVHQCTQCNKIFTNRVGLRKHSLTHSEPLPMPWELILECPTCQKKFSTSIGLKRHSLIHKNNSNGDKCKASKDAKTITNSVDKDKTDAKEFECLINGVDESINDTNSIIVEKIISDKSTTDVEKLSNNKKTNDAEKSSNDKPAKNIKNSNNNGNTNNAENSNNVECTNNVEKSSNDKETKDFEKSSNDSNSNSVIKPFNDTPFINEKSSFDSNSNVASESIRDIISSSVKPNDQTSQNQNDSVGLYNQSKNATGSSCDSQFDQSICCDEPNTSRLSLPIVSDELISCLSCKICSRQFSHVKAFNKHVQWHKFNDDAVDGEETIGLNDDPKQHRNTIGSVTNGIAFVELLAFVKCDICTEKFKTADILKKHAYDVHQVTVTSPILYQCKSCEKSFPWSNSLFMHLKSHTSKGSGEEDSMPFECASCEKCFRLKDDLLEHVKSHLNGVETDLLTKPLLNGSSNVSNVNGDNSDLKIDSDDLKNNQNDSKVELAEDFEELKFPKFIPMYECSDCDKKFVRKCYLSSHIRCHKKKKKRVDTNSRSIKLISPPKQHKCPVCDEHFRVKTSLACHIQKHSSDKVLRKSLKRSSDDNTCTTEDGVRSSKRTHKDIS